MLPSFMNKSFTRARYPLAKDHGTESVDYSATPDLADFTGVMQPGAGTTDQVNRNGAEIVKTIYAHPGADVHHADLVTVNGKTYYVNGEPEEWETSILDHVVIQMSRWLG